MNQQQEFSDVYLRGYPRLVAELTLISGSRAAAEEAAQEAYSRAWGRWDTLGRYDDPQAWVRRVASNLLVSRWRRLRSALRMRPLVATLEAIDPPESDWLDLQPVLRSLPLVQRQALVLAALEGFTADEIAVEMNVAPATVRSWLHRARVSARSALETRAHATAASKEMTDGD